MTAAAFKAKCLALMDEVAERNSEVVITKRGKPVARLVPVAPKKKDIFGCMKGTFEVADPNDRLLSTDDVWEVHGENVADD